MKHAKPRHRPLRAIPDGAHELPEQEGEAIDWQTARPLRYDLGPTYTTPTYAAMLDTLERQRQRYIARATSPEERAEIESPRTFIWNTPINMAPKLIFNFSL